MADYAFGRTGGSLRDALNELFPMTGLGEYSTQFPPQTGSPQPSGPVPIPPPRPPMARPPYLPPPGAALAQGPSGRTIDRPGLPLALQGADGLPFSGLQGNVDMLGGTPGAPVIAGGFSLPIGNNRRLNVGGNYAGALGLRPGFGVRGGFSGTF